MDALATVLREHPELALFLTLALGFLLGRARIGGFRLGNVVGTLLAGVLIGQLAIPIHPLVKIVFFDLFLFATGYKVGPQFFAGLKKNALPQVAVTVVLCVTSLFTAFGAAKLFGYDSGTAAGLLAGAFTESTVIGTAGDMIARLGLSAAETERLVNNIPVAYAVSYLVGTGFVVWFLSTLAPRLLRIDLRQESRVLDERLGRGSSGQDPRRAWSLRTYAIGAGVAGRTVAALEHSFAPDRVFIEAVHRGDALVEPSPETVLDAGDRVAVNARAAVHAAVERQLGPDVHDGALLEVPAVVAALVVTKKTFAGRTLADIAAEHGRGVVLLKLVRAGKEMPFAPHTVVERGDLLQVSGSARNVARVAELAGYAEPDSSETDIVFVALGILAGGLVGLLTLTVGGLPLSLTASGGALIMGLVFGWLRSIRPTFGRIPEPALWVFDTVGLAVFIGVVGLNAGPGFVAGLGKTGPSLLLVGFVVAVVPHITALLFGHHVLKMNPVLLLGACAGAGTVTAALRAIQDEAGSDLPVLGYTVPYAVGNILLTAWGPVIVVLTR